MTGVEGKPARLQVDPSSISSDDKPPQTGTNFNIWYLQWSGGDSQERYINSKFRVDLKKDSGYTRASSKSAICLFFARGCCYQGKYCKYLHRLPTEDDYYPPTEDCFGREKTSNFKDDMSGVGSFNRVNRTLYVGGISVNKSVENVISKHFQEFGSIENVKVLYNKSCAFVTYKLEPEAQFAKEAMQNQSLDENEVLNIRWASEDPNPETQKNEKRRLEEQAISTVRTLLNGSKKQKIKESDNGDDKLRIRPSTTKFSHISESQNIGHRSPGGGPSEDSFFGSSTLKSLSKVRNLHTSHQKSSPIVDYPSSDEE